MKNKEIKEILLNEKRKYEKILDIHLDFPFFMRKHAKKIFKKIIALEKAISLLEKEET